MPAGCAPGTGGIAGERKVAGGDEATRARAYGVDERAAREEGTVTGPEEVQRGQEGNGYSNGDYHATVVGGKASSRKSGLGIDLSSDRNILVQNMEEGYGDRDYIDPYVILNYRSQEHRSTVVQDLIHNEMRLFSSPFLTLTLNFI
ncbi:hypothetical protein S83_038033 [Arachis hypogaea]